MPSQSKERLDWPRYIELPARPGLWTTRDIAPDRLSFPIEVKGRLGAGGWLVLLPLTLLLDVFAMLCLVRLAAPGWAFATVLVALIALFTALVFMAWTAFILSDHWVATPRIVIDQHGFVDRRVSDQKIAWTDVASIRFHIPRHGLLNDSLVLQLKQPIASKQPRSTIHSIVCARFQRPDLVVMPLACLSLSGVRLATIVSELVRTHGGDAGCERSPQGVRLGP